MEQAHISQFLTFSVCSVSELLETNQFDVNCCDEKQRTCLHIASSRGNSTIVRLLLQHGANPNIKDCVNNLPIHVAIIASHVEVVTVSYPEPARAEDIFAFATVAYRTVSSYGPERVRNRTVTLIWIYLENYRVKLTDTLR